jgi:hypothetical protein
LTEAAQTTDEDGERTERIVRIRLAPGRRFLIASVIATHRRAVFHTRLADAAVVAAAED